MLEIAGSYAAGNGGKARLRLSQFWETWEKQNETLYAICLQQLGGDAENAADAVSNVMLKSLEFLIKSETNVSDMPAWLCRMAYNQCNDIHRRNNVFIDSLDKIYHMESNRKEPDPEQALSHQERGKRVRQLVSELPDHLREPFLLRFYEDLSYEKIGIRLSISEQAIRKRVQRARNRLKEKVQVDVMGY